MIKEISSNIIEKAKNCLRCIIYKDEQRGGNTRVIKNV